MGLRSDLSAYPGLTSGANECRRFATGIRVEGEIAERTLVTLLCFARDPVLPGYTEASLATGLISGIERAAPPKIGVFRGPFSQSEGGEECGFAGG
jgi:hypothetical protein